MKVLAYGEVLFDVFGTEEKIGGAPFNFAAHMARLGADVELMSAVGQDDRGAQVRGYLQKYRISDRLLAETTFPTGVCRVTLNVQGVPSYELLKPAAWDNIPWTEKAVETKRDLLYFGSLSQREPVSEETLHRVLEKVSSRYRLFDCNIRPPYASREAVRQGLACCTHLKVSREEAPVLTELGMVPAYEDRRRQEWCRAVAEAYGLEQVLLTLDRDGAAVYDATDGQYAEQSAEPVTVVSTVGAGDSFAAGYMASLLSGDPIPVSLHKAILLSSHVIQFPGALPFAEIGT